MPLASRRPPRPVVASVGTGSPAGQVITFTMPNGSSLPLGFTLSIHLRLQFRPQLQADTQVTTPVDVVSDQQFDTCAAFRDNGIARPTLTANQPDCATMTTVFPLASTPMTITKGVRGVAAGPLGSFGVATNDDLGVLKTVPTNPTSCRVAQHDDQRLGLLQYPCVPITRPGGIEEWVAKFSNSGNVSVGQEARSTCSPPPTTPACIDPRLSRVEVDAEAVRVPAVERGPRRCEPRGRTTSPRRASLRRAATAPTSRTPWG